MEEFVSQLPAVGIFLVLLVYLFLQAWSARKPRNDEERNQAHNMVEDIHGVVTQLDAERRPLVYGSDMREAIKVLVSIEEKNAALLADMHARLARLEGNDVTGPRGIQ